MIIVYILTAQSAAGLDIRVGIILKQYKVNADYLNLPNFFWKCYTAECTPDQNYVLSSVLHYLIMSMTENDYCHLPSGYKSEVSFLSNLLCLKDGVTLSYKWFF